MPLKRKSDRSGATAEPPVKKKQVCVLHLPGIKHDEFVSFSSLKDPQERLHSLKNIRDKRLAEPMGSNIRMANVCCQIPDNIGEEHGYHRVCHQRFTMNMSRLSSRLDQPVSCEKRGARHSSGEKILFEPDCIFCNSIDRIHVFKGGLRTSERTTMFEREGWNCVLDLAESKDDEKLLRRIRGFDLFACEARYHPNCRKIYTRDPDRAISTDERAKSTQAKLEAAHECAFGAVVEYLEKSVINEHQVVKLTELEHIYKVKLAETEYSNPKHRAAKLKERLLKHPMLAKELVFTTVTTTDNILFTVVFSSRIDTKEAVGMAFRLVSRDNILYAAQHLRECLLKSFRDSDDVVWPPSPLALGVNKSTIPKALYKFLKALLCETSGKTTDRVERLILSIGQDICRAATAGAWTMPKHILLSVTLHHLFRSKQLITLVNRLGHSENYSYCMELETAHAMALEKTSTLLTPKIERGQQNVLFHSEWDNFNQNLTGVQGPTTCNTAAGIMLQEVSSSSRPTTCKQPESVQRTGRRSYPTDDQRSLPSMVPPRRAEPSIDIKSKDHPDKIVSAFKQALVVYTLWTFCRKASSLSKQNIPAFAGFVSATGAKPKKVTTLDFYPSIVEPITEFNVVRELLDKCQAATEEVGQSYTITTFDLGVCMKALSLIWDNPVRYKGHIVLIGAFHTIMNYLNMLGHKMTGSGYSEILIEANLVSTGCLRKVLHGKKYSKSLWCLKVVSECFERLLIQAYFDQGDETDSSNADALNQLIIKLDKDALDKTVKDATVKVYIQEFQNFQQKVRDGCLGKTAKFWMAFIDHARLVFLLIYAIKVNDFSLFHKCMADMADLFFSYGGHNYSRYLALFDVFLTNIETSHPGATNLLKQGAISVARSLTPGSLSAVDKTMEETFMKYAKSRGGASCCGLTGILQNYGAYQRWIRTSSERSKFYQATLEMTGLASDMDNPIIGQHKETRPSNVRKGESAVQRAISAVKGYSNPFEMADKDKLYILSSGAPVPLHVEDDVLRAENVGKEAKAEFIEKRFVVDQDSEDKLNFFDRVKKIKLKKMDTCNKKVKLTSSQGKIVQYQEQGNIAFQLLVKSQLLETPLDIDELMKYSLTPVPHSLGTPDGFLAKTDKAKLVHYLTDHLPVTSDPPPELTLYVEDGNAIIHALKELPPTFKWIALKLLDQLGRKINVVFSTDMYIPGSIKFQERLRRGCSERILLEGENTRKPADFKVFLQNDDNKKQLFQVIHRVWKSPDAAPRLLAKTRVIVVEGQAFKLSTVDGESVTEEHVKELGSTQEETDTRVILYLRHALDNGFQNAMVRSPDSDIFFIMLYYATSLRPLTLYFDTGSGPKRRIINITEIAVDQGAEMCEALLGFHCYTGEDCNSAFKRKGKVTPFKKPQKFPRYSKAFVALGNLWELNEDMAGELESFTCLMYGHPRIRDIDTVRSSMLRKIVGGDDILKSRASKVDLSRLPPCKRSLTPHIRRANCRARQWKLAHVNNPSIPIPTDHGWTHEDGHLEPTWSEGPILPESLYDFLDNREETSDSEEGEGEIVSDLESESDESDLD